MYRWREGMCLRFEGGMRAWPDLSTPERRKAKPLLQWCGLQRADDTDRQELRGGNRRRLLYPGRHGTPSLGVGR